MKKPRTPPNSFIDDNQNFFQTMQQLGVKPLSQMSTPSSQDTTNPTNDSADASPNSLSSTVQSSSHSLSFLDESDAHQQLQSALQRAPSPVTKELPVTALPVTPAKRGKNLKPQATLDLHGDTQQQVLQRLQDFFAYCRQQRFHTVLIITGKGLHSGPEGPILPQIFFQWIKGPAKQFVQRFSFAPHHLGGQGAVIVYLKSF